MQKSMLVVVDADATAHRGVVRVASAEGLEVVVCATVRAAFNACCALSPDCLVVGVSAADHEGFWLLGAIRARPEEACALPLVVLAARDPSAHSATTTRIRALEAGADVVLQKPIETSEVIAQVKALTKMATRVRVRRATLSGGDGLGVLAGDLDLEPVTEVLRELEAKRWSGELYLGDRRGAGHGLSVAIAGGALLGAQLGDHALDPLDTLREMLAWSGRRFELVPAPALSSPSGAPSLADLLQALLAAPDAMPLGASRADSDLPELSARLPPPPPVPASTTAVPMTPPPPTDPMVPMDGASVPLGSIAPLAEAPGHRLVESVQQSNRPDPRAEIDS